MKTQNKLAELSLKNKARAITVILLIAIAIYSIPFFLKCELNNNYLDCGKVISKSNDEVAIKYGTRTKLYLNIQFEKAGFLSISCEPTIYFSKNIGDNVCFNLNKNEADRKSLRYILGLACIIIFISLLIVSLVIYLIID